MALAPKTHPRKIRARPRSLLTEAAWVRYLLIAVALAFLGIFLVLPLVEVFRNALSKGFELYFRAFDNDNNRSAIWLTLLTAAVVVPLNTFFGICAAWAITKFEFRGKNFLITLIDLPFGVSPVISGMIFALLLGAQGVFGSWLIDHGVNILNTPYAIILATIFVTFPFVAREVIPLMQSQGASEEEAALTLGAGGLRIFWKVTLPKVKWSLLYGITLCNARAMGEFGAVSVVSGHILGDTQTMPLQIEYLYQGGASVAAFALASVLALLALLTLVIKSFIEWRGGGQESR